MIQQEHDNQPTFWKRLIAQRRLWAIIALCIPFVALLWPPFYNLDQPELLGFPFFYWYQLAWIGITALITATLYWLHIEF
jgi:hypothetical protein